MPELPLEQAAALPGGWSLIPVGRCPAETREPPAFRTKVDCREGLRETAQKLKWL